MNQEHIADFKDGKLAVALVTPTDGGRGEARIELGVYGARYPYKLSANEARALASTLITAAASLELQSRGTSSHR